MDNKIIVGRLNSKTFTVEVTYASTGGIFDLTGYTATFGLKERKDSKEYILFIDGVIDTPESGVISFELTAANNDLPPKVYVYGVQIYNSVTGHREEVVICEPYEVTYTVLYEPDPNA